MRGFTQRDLPLGDIFVRRIESTWTLFYLRPIWSSVRLHVAVMPGPPGSGMPQSAQPASDI